jgi:hypothetical protein
VSGGQEKSVNREKKEVWWLVSMWHMQKNEFILICPLCFPFLSGLAGGRLIFCLLKCYLSRFCLLWTKIEFGGQIGIGGLSVFGKELGKIPWRVDDSESLLLSHLHDESSLHFTSSFPLLPYSISFSLLPLLSFPPPLTSIPSYQ